MATKKKITTDPGKLIKRYTLHHTDNGHYKYYYVSVYQKDGEVSLEKKWGRIGSVNGSISLNRIRGRNLTQALAEADRQIEELRQSKIDKGYKITKDTKNVPPPPSEEPINTISSRFRDIL